MSDPLLDPRDQELEADLLRAGRDVQLSASAQARILTSLGIAAGGLTVAGEAAATGGALGKLSALVSGKAALVAGMVSVGALGGGAWYVATSPAEPVAPRVVEAPAQTTKQVEPKSAEVLKVEELEPSAEAEEPSSDATQAPAQTPAGSDRSQAERGNTLGDEVLVVESASRALRSGNPQAALGRLAEYRQRFPRGKMALEAQVLRIEALARAGRQADAARLARSFLKRHPKSPVAARIRRYAE